MADAPRPRPAEHYNPRPLILGICFFWGVAMGFCLFYFSPPKQMAVPAPTNQGVHLTPQPIPTPPNREAGIPRITDVSPTPEALQTPRLRLETMNLMPPPPILTTEGGMTGRTAKPVQTNRSVSPDSRPARRPPMTSPPPIPELMP